MAFYCTRMGNKSVLSTIGRIPTVLNSAHYAQMAASVPKISYKKFEASKLENHDERNASLKRPLSPHLSIYSIQLTSTLSITHRFAGMALSGYISALGIGALVLPNDVSHYLSLLESFSPATLFLVKLTLAAPFSYHLVNGIRHLYWDTARGLTIKEVYKTGYAMLATSAILTLILAAL